MSSSEPSSIPAGNCLVQVVTREMETQPALEAVRVDRGTGSISVATLGGPQHDTLANTLAERLRNAAPAGPGALPTNTCGLLAGTNECGDCPLSGAIASTVRYTVQHEGQTTTIARMTCPTAPRFWRWRNQALLSFTARDVHLPEDEHAENEWKMQLAAAVVCGATGLLGWTQGESIVARVAFGIAYITGAFFPGLEVWERLRERRVDVHFLMLAVAAGAAAIGAWGEGAALLFLFSFSGALEHYAMGRTHREIRALIRAAPKEACVVGDDGVETRIPIEQLAPRMRLLVKPGELFPADAEITQGNTAADESNLTGEAVPVEKRVGDEVLGGTLNLWGAIEATVLRPPQQSALQRIIVLIRESQRLKAPSQRFTDRFGTTYTLLVLGATAAMFLVWWLILGRPPLLSQPSAPSAFYLAMSLLVVASPCALVLSIPSAILAAIAYAARRGILLRGGAAVEKLAEIKVVAMDKTGTLTTGDLRVERVESFPPGREAEVAAIAYGIERLSTHPLARAITRYGKQRGIEAPDVADVTSVTGLGVRATVNGAPATLGRHSFVAQNSPNMPEPEATAAAGISEVWLNRGDLLGRILLRDDIRPQARAIVSELRAKGLYTIALTGDRKFAGEYLQRELALDEVRAELSPEEKVRALVDFSRQGKRTAMIGDGVNDAPALAAAHVGVAMGARGSDAALEQADVVLMHDRLENFRIAYDLSCRARRVIRQNIAISLGALLILVVLAVAARLPLGEGVLGHEGSTVLVVLNSLRLLFHRQPLAGSVDSKAPGLTETRAEAS